LAIKFRITIEEGFGVIQKVLVMGFEAQNLGNVAERLDPWSPLL